MKENEEITNLERFELLIEDCKGHRELYGESSVGEYDIEIMQHILSDYKRVLKENEELKNKKEKTIKKIGQFSKKAETLPYDYDYLNGVSDVIKIVEENL